MEKSKFNRYKKMALSGELFYKIKQKMSVCFIKNKSIKNLVLEDKEYRRLKRKYYKIIENRKPTQKMKKSDYVWVFWYQGIENAPLLVKKCIDSIKTTFKKKKLVIITKDNYKKYVEFPDYIMKKFEKGLISFTHFSDLLRIELLAKYGGIWCDSTLLFTGEIPDYVEDADLFVFKNVSLDRDDASPIVASSWFMAAKSNNDIIEATRDLLYDYHKKEKVLKNYFLIHLFFTIATEKYDDQWKKIPTYSNVNPHILQFELLEEYNKERFDQIKSMSFVHKLNKVLVNEDKNKYTFYDYILEKKK